MQKLLWRHKRSAKFKHQFESEIKMANSQCALSNQNIVEQLKETAKKKHMKATQTSRAGGELFFVWKA